MHKTGGTKVQLPLSFDNTDIPTYHTQTYRQFMCSAHGKTNT